jgi:hypothetical protein
MQLWQLDLVGGVFLVDGTECKVFTSVDDHSRYCVIAAVLPRASGRAVCLAFAAALARHGVPDEVLSDNGKQFTGRFGQPRAGEVLFDRICRENGVTHLLTRPNSPTTTGKIERFHQTLRRELLDDHDPFADLEAAQEAVDAFVAEYNTARPHQALDMAVPADRFTPRPVEADLPLRLPPALTSAPVTNTTGAETASPDTVSSDAAVDAPIAPVAEVVLSTNGMDPVNLAVEVDRVVPPSGNLGLLRRQQFWLGQDRGGQTVTLWADTTLVHVLADGVRIKTLPSRLSIADLQRLLAGGGRPAGPPPLPVPAGPIRPGDPVEVDRIINGTGCISLGGRAYPIGFHLAGTRVTVRLDRGLLQLVADGVLLRSLPNPLTAEQIARLRDARPAGPPPAATAQPLRVERRVSAGGSLVVAGQRIQVGTVHAGRTLTIQADTSTFRVLDGDQVITTTPRTTLKEIARFKVRKPESKRHVP